MTEAGQPEHRLILAVLCVALGMVVIDNTIIAVAVPSIGEQLHADETALQWVTTSYSLVLSGLLLPLAVLGDRFGRKGLLLSGLLIFTVASAAAGFSTSASQLALLRGVMGVGGACAMPATLSILGNVFSEEERGHAIALWAGFAGLAAAAGPVAGGLLLGRFWWGSVLLVNVPVGLLAIAGTLALVPTSRDPSAAPIDGPGSLLWTAALTAILFGTIEGPVRGWTSTPVLGAFVATVVLLALFAARERAAPAPILAPATARHPAMRAGAIAVPATFFCVFGGQFVLTQWYQGPKGLSAVAAGLCFVPQATGALSGSLLASRLAQRFGHPRAAVVALAALVAGLVLTMLAVAASSALAVATAFAVVGLGAGGTSAAVELIMSSVPPERAGSAAGINETIVEGGGALGIAALGSVLALGYGPTAALPLAIGVATAALVAVARLGRLLEPSVDAGEALRLDVGRGTG